MCPKPDDEVLKRVKFTQAEKRRKKGDGSEKQSNNEQDGGEPSPKRKKTTASAAPKKKAAAKTKAASTAPKGCFESTQEKSNAQEESKNKIAKEKNNG